MNKQATFTRFDECSREDIDIVMRSHHAFAEKLPDRVLEHLLLLDGDFGGFNVDRLEHSLQTATRAYRDNRDEEFVVCALLHDIGDTLGSFDHGAVAAAILKPFVSAANHWMLEHHPTFQGYYYFQHIGANKDARDKFKDHEHYQHTLEFLEKYDMPAFDDKYDSMSLEEFKPMVRRVLRKSPAAAA